MTKNEFLAASLPYGLVVINEEGFEKMYCAVHYSYEFDTGFHEFKPIVRPLSDLTKECVQADYNDGEPFIPLVDLAKLMYNDISWTGSFELVDDRVYFDSYESFNEFWYDNESGEFEVIFKMGIGDEQYSCNHFKIYQQLLKWHFDLITEDCEKVYVTEEFNPYK